MNGPDGPEQREADAQEQSWAEDERIERDEDQADSELMDIAQARMNGFCHSNEFGERIPHIIALTPVDSSPVTDKILDAMEILR